MIRTIKVGAVVLASATIFAAGWAGQGWRKDAEIAEIRQAQANARATGAEQAMADLQTATARITAVADRYASVETTFGKKLDALRKDFENVKKTPLPAGCRPDAGRLRNLRAGVDAARAAAAGQ